MKVLVTGGAGYIGSHTVVDLLDNGFEVVVVDNLCNSKIAVVERVKKITNKDFVFYQNDVCDESALDAIFEKEKPGITHEDLKDLMVEIPDENDPDKDHYQAVWKKYNAFCSHLREYHCDVWVKNEQGLSDLYRIVTEGHTTYFSKIPKTPRPSAPSKPPARKCCSPARAR